VTDVYVIDLSNMAYRNFHGNKLNTSDGNPKGHVFGFMLEMIRLFQKNKKVVFAIDKTPNRKIEIYPEYKANRIRLEDDYKPVPDLEQLVNFMNCSCIYAPDEEADDVIASFCNKYSDLNITIISGDADLYQLVDENRIKQYDPLKRKFVDKDDLFRKYKLKQYDKISLWKSMFGDAGDNIKPAMQRLLKAQLVPVIEHCNGTPDDFANEITRISALQFYYGSNFIIADELLNTISVISKKTLRKISTISFWKNLKQNYDIVKLRGDIDFIEQKNIGDAEGLRSFLKKFECESLIDNVLTTDIGAK